ncbi:TetR/AcrR family transcriptional regulator [Catellatospora bangladeshensis]|uniref:TetR/AcrR family transcriptional regulator n=1 Tax=Catellatospora bangladeshensis TaxID=310355 RepID=UPI003610FA3F
MTAVAQERTRQRLLDEACRLFAMHSFAGTSLQMIADTLGVTKAAIYHHFKTRDEILTAVIQPAIEELRTAIAVAEVQRTPPPGPTPC